MSELIKKQSLLRAIAYKVSFFRRKGYLIDSSSTIIYVPIPKNANSYLKAIFIANSSVAWSFDPGKETAIMFFNRYPEARKICSPSRGQVRDAKTQTVTVFRDPAQRLVSAFLDKLAKRKPGDKGLEKFAGEFAEVVGVERAATDLTFNDFIDYVGAVNDFFRDPHVKTQLSFIRNVRIDRVFGLDDLCGFLGFLRSHGFTVDLRVSLRSDVAKRTDYRGEEDVFFSGHTSLAELSQWGGFLPYQYFYDRKIIAKLMKIYGEDIDFYRASCSGESEVDWLAKFPCV